EAGWSVGRNLQIDIRWGAGDADRFRRYAAELVGLAPDVILATSGSTVPWLLQATRSVPIVFTQTPDPVGAGFVASLAHPGGNITGFTQFDYSIGGKSSRACLFDRRLSGDFYACVRLLSGTE